MGPAPLITLTSIVAPDAWKQKDKSRFCKLLVSAGSYILYTFLSPCCHLYLPLMRHLIRTHVSSRAAGGKNRPLSLTWFLTAFQSACQKDADLVCAKLSRSPGTKPKRLKGETIPFKQGVDVSLGCVGPSCTPV